LGTNRRRNQLKKASNNLDWREHIRLRPGMYIGKLGDGSAAPKTASTYLIKEVIDNFHRRIRHGLWQTNRRAINEHGVRVRDFGRGIPLGQSGGCGQ
jgi:topoisomerase-4 subunit B